MVLVSSTSTVLLIVWPIICVVAASELSAIQLEREALLNSGLWNRSSTVTSDHCNWTGVACNLQGSINGIDLNNHRIEGKLNKFNFSRFPNLEFLKLGSNNLNGSIKLQVGDLPKLRYLDLSQNRLTGAIPQEIGSMKNLVELHLGGNRIYGSYGRLSALGGSIPSTLGEEGDNGPIWLYTASVPVEEWFLQDHQKCIDCLSVSPPDLEEQHKYFFNRSPSSSDVEPEEIADPEPKEMPYCDWLLEEKDHRMRLDQRMFDSERMVMELTLEMEAEMADRRRMKLEAEMADLEDQPPWKDEEPKWSPINFMLKEDLSP